MTAALDDRPGRASIARLRSLWTMGLKAPIWTAVVIAATARLLTAIVLRVSTRGYVVPDEVQYNEMVNDVLSGRSHDSPAWADYYNGLWGRVRTFSEPHLLLTRIIGDTRFAGQLVSATFGVVTVAFTAMFAIRVFGKRAGLIAGLIAALWPSQVVFSSVAIRDSTVWACTAIAVYCVYGLTRATAWKAAAAWFAGFVLALFLLDGARAQTFAVVVFAATLTVLAAFRGSWMTRLLVAAIVVVALPVVFGHGVANRSELSRFDSLASMRYANTIDSHTSITPTDDSATGSTARIPDESASSSIRHFPHGTVAVLFRPYPWDAGADTGLRMAKLESIPWFALFVTALAGLWLSRQRWRELLCPLLVACGMLFVYALAEGNYGTAFRHKGELVWIVAIFAAAAIDRRLDVNLNGNGDPQTPSR